jgi:hypothetical protein
MNRPGLVLPTEPPRWLTGRPRGETSAEGSSSRSPGGRRVFDALFGLEAVGLKLLRVVAVARIKAQHLVTDLPGYPALTPVHWRRLVDGPMSEDLYRCAKCDGG